MEEMRNVQARLEAIELGKQRDLETGDASEPEIESLEERE